MRNDYIHKDNKIPKLRRNVKETNVVSVWTNQILMTYKQTMKENFGSEFTVRTILILVIFFLQFSKTNLLKNLKTNSIIESPKMITKF